MYERTALLIVDWTDEVTPADDLAGWALFLAGLTDGYGVESHPADQARANDGQVFDATRVRFRYAPATRQPDGIYTFADPDPGWTLHALAYGHGLGWGSDMMVGVSDALVRTLVAEDRDATPAERAGDDRVGMAALLAEFGTDPTEWLVWMGPDERLKVRFHALPPRCEIVEDAAA